MRYDRLGPSKTLRSNRGCARKSQSVRQRVTGQRDTTEMMPETCWQPKRHIVHHRRRSRVAPMSSFLWLQQAFRSTLARCSSAPFNARECEGAEKEATSTDRCTRKHRGSKHTGSPLTRSSQASTRYCDRSTFSLIPLYVGQRRKRGGWPLGREGQGARPSPCPQKVGPAGVTFDCGFLPTTSLHVLQP